MRDARLYLGDILKAVRKIERYTKGLSLRELKKDELRIDGVARNLEIIGEAAKNIPASIKSKHSSVEWKKISGLRDILAHEYFGIDADIMWDIVINKLPDLKKQISKILKDLP